MLANAGQRRYVALLNAFGAELNRSGVPLNRISPSMYWGIPQLALATRIAAGQAACKQITAHRAVGEQPRPLIASGATVTHNTMGALSVNFAAEVAGRA